MPNKKDISLQDLMNTKNELNEGLTGLDKFFTEMDAQGTVPEEVADDPRNTSNEDMNYEDVLRDVPEENEPAPQSLKDIYAENPQNAADNLRPSWEKPRISAPSIDEEEGNSTVQRFNFDNEPAVTENNEPVVPQKPIYRTQPTKTRKSAASNGVIAVSYNDKTCIEMSMSESLVFSASQKKNAQSPLKVVVGNSYKAECVLTSGTPIVKFGLAGGEIEIREDVSGKHMVKLTNTANNTVVQIQADVEAEIVFAGRTVQLSANKAEMYI